jgi:hypothetical protein
LPLFHRSLLDDIQAVGTLPLSAQPELSSTSAAALAPIFAAHPPLPILPSFEESSQKIPGLSEQGWTNYRSLGAPLPLSREEVDGLLTDPSLPQSQKELLQMDRLQRFGSAAPGAVTLSAQQKSNALSKMQGGIWEQIVSYASEAYNAILKLIKNLSAIADKLGGKKGKIVANLASGLQTLGYAAGALVSGDFSKAAKAAKEGASLLASALSEVELPSSWASRLGRVAKGIPVASVALGGYDMYTYMNKSKQAGDQGDTAGSALWGMTAAFAGITTCLALAGSLPGPTAVLNGAAAAMGAITEASAILVEM